MQVLIFSFSFFQINLFHRGYFTQNDNNVSEPFFHQNPPITLYDLPLAKYIIPDPRRINCVTNYNESPFIGKSHLHSESSTPSIIAAASATAAPHWTIRTFSPFLSINFPTLECVWPGAKLKNPSSLQPLCSKFTHVKVKPEEAGTKKSSKYQSLT